jgi:predicted O-methyltransferase YrrM
MLRKRERRETRRDLKQLRISSETVDRLEHVKRCAQQISGENWDYYSGTLRPQHAAVFEQVISVLPSNAEVVHYLEIGSASGASMSLVATLLKRSHPNFRLVSIDPYYASGYAEGERVLNRSFAVNINKDTRERALRLYAEMQIDVELIEMDSTQGLVELIKRGSLFDMIYIDGFHEGLQPAIDFGLSRPLLKLGGVILLDDHLWPDVEPIKLLCDIMQKKSQLQVRSLLTD